MKTLITVVFGLLMTICPAFSYPTNATLLWQLPLNNSSLGFPAVGPDGTIYVMQNGYPAYTFSALHPDGSTNWQITLTAVAPGGVNVPVVGSDGNLYVFAAVSSGNSYLYALNLADGSTNWGFAGDTASQYSFCLIPALDTNGTVYFCTGSGTVDAVTNGVLEWSALSDAGLAYGEPVVGADGTIYVFANDSPLQFYALNPDGSLKWSTNYPGAYFPQYPPALAENGTIYFSGGPYFCAVNPADGSLEWELPATNFLYQSFEYENPEVGPNGTIYIETYAYNTNFLFALTPNGTVEWIFPLPQNSGNSLALHESSCAVAADGEIYVTTSVGTVYSLAPDGTTNWSYQAGSSGLQAPVIGPDGTVYVSSCSAGNNILYAFYGPAPVACSAWPQFNKNSRHVTDVGTAYLRSPFMQTNGFQFNVAGTGNLPVCSCASSDLVNWTNIGQVVLTNGTASFVDTQASNFPHRFYQAFPQ